MSYIVQMRSFKSNYFIIPLNYSLLQILKTVWASKPLEWPPIIDSPPIKTDYCLIWLKSFGMFGWKIECYEAYPFPWKPISMSALNPAFKLPEVIESCEQIKIGFSGMRICWSEFRFVAFKSGQKSIAEKLFHSICIVSLLAHSHSISPFSASKMYKNYIK